MPRQSHVFVALLRGINVGGKSLISMAALRTYFEEMGFGHVTTYINSGNVIFTATTADERKLEDKISKALVGHFERELRVVVVPIADIEDLLNAVPTSWEELGNKRDVMFLCHEVDSPDVIDQLSPRDGVDVVTYVPRALLWWADKNFVTRSALSRFASSPLYKQVTVRTLGTVQKVHAIMVKTQAQI